MTSDPRLPATNPEALTDNLQSKVTRVWFSGHSERWQYGTIARTGDSVEIRLKGGIVRNRITGDSIEKLGVWKK